MAGRPLNVTGVPGLHGPCHFWLAVFAVQESLVSEEIVHDLDTCEVTVEGDELNPEQEGLEVDMARLQHKGIEVSGSDLGVIFTGERKLPLSPRPLPAQMWRGSPRRRGRRALPDVLSDAW